ncbi:transporter [Paenibacillus baekrokdamisoli]|uniref:Transporter n=1 Tax=Paenibacillus baekrokdamisoli TaxID=1712516 RepID=A0A3G9J8Y7_9BACL|nr:carbohydrate ABC transporter permease [Paenibacillus baekrokdamisoli]BBH20318.1 transporter [Paenibacillus baekrokdamisoli]
MPSGINTKLQQWVGSKRDEASGVGRKLWQPLHKFLQRGHKVERTRVYVLGRQITDGLLFKFAIYAILTAVAVIYLQPVLYMISTSLKRNEDLFDPTVTYFPKVLDWENYRIAFKGLKYVQALWQTALVALLAALFQVGSCALTGYAFARLRIPGKKFWYFIVLLTFLVPVQTLVIPIFVVYSKLGWLNGPLPFLIPALLGQGLKGALFVMIFRQFFSTLPKELEESAKMDGSGSFRTFVKIMLPLSRPAMLVVFLFSFVWHWNDYFEPAMYLQSGKFLMMANQMSQMPANLSVAAGNAITAPNLIETQMMAGAFLVILPPLLLYAFAQRYFVEGIERTGVVGE